MTQNLKIEVLTGDISIDGTVVSNLVTKEELSTAIVKKADLGTDGKIPTSQLPAEIVNTAGIVNEVKLQLETSIKDAVDESNAYAESYTDNALSSKADLTSGKVPLEQLPAIDQYPQFGTALSNLSTSILSATKQRTDQLEKTKADLGEDGKVLREQIPSYEKISGLPEQLEVMSTQTAAVSGELDEHKLQTADQIDTLKENIEANVQQLTNRQSHLMRTYATKELGVDAKVGVKPGEYFYVRSENEKEMLVEYQNAGGSAVTTGKSYPSAGYVQSVAEFTAMPFVPGESYSVNRRVKLDNGDIVRSTVAGNTVNPNVDMTGWLNPKSRTYYIEEFGASESATPVQNSAAIREAFLALSDDDKLYQTSSLIEIDKTDCSLIDAINNVAIKLNLKYAGAGASSIAAVFVNKLHDSLIDISVDGNNKNLRLLQCNECLGSVIPSNTILKNSYGTLSLVAGVLTRDSDDMQIVCKVRNISTDGTQAVRGVMISDQTITKNTSYIAPQIENVTCPVGSAVVDADGVYAEHSNANHSGGIRIQNGSYKNCSKRFIKVTMPNPIITGNIGRNDNTAEKMYAFVSSYKDDAGLISDNDFQTSGSVGYGLEFGIASSELKATVGKNKLIASVVSNDSYAYRIQGSINNINISIGEAVGFSGLFSQVSTSTAVNQVLSLKTGSFNNLQSSDLRNCITISGDFRLFNVDDIECANSVASRFFISAANISDNIANVTNIRHSYSFGSWGGTTKSRPKNLQDHTANRYVDGKLFAKLATTPASGTYRAGDIIEFTNPTSWVGAVYDGSGWKNYGFINKQSVTTYDPPSIPANGSINTTVSLDGTEVGSLVQATFSVYNASIRIYAVVSSSNTVTVTFENTSSSAIDLGSGTLRVKLV